MIDFVQNKVWYPRIHIIQNFWINRETESEFDRIFAKYSSFFICVFLLGIVCHSAFIHNRHLNMTVCGCACLSKYYSGYVFYRWVIFALGINQISSYPFFLRMRSFTICSTLKSVEVSSSSLKCQPINFIFLSILQPVMKNSPWCLVMPNWS